jgi:hypothetical protein
MTAFGAFHFKDTSFCNFNTKKPEQFEIIIIFSIKCKQAGIFSLINVGMEILGKWISQNKGHG